MIYGESFEKGTMGVNSWVQAVSAPSYTFTHFAVSKLWAPLHVLYQVACRHKVQRTFRST